MFRSATHRAQDSEATKLVKAIRYHAGRLHVLSEFRMLVFADEYDGSSASLHVKSGEDRYGTVLIFDGSRIARGGPWEDELVPLLRQIMARLDAWQMERDRLIEANFKKMIKPTFSLEKSNG
jgi:hypothetical protein